MNITTIVYKLSFDVACLLDEPSEVTKEDLESIQNSITLLEKQLLNHTTTHENTNTKRNKRTRNIH